MAAGRDTSPSIAAKLLALEPEHVGLELGEVTDDELAALRDALVFCRDLSAEHRAIELHPSACTPPEPSGCCSPLRPR